MEHDDHQEAEQMPAVMNSSMEKIAKAHPDIIAELRKLDPIKTAATFAGLLAMPELQANCFRIEALVHLAATYCEGRMAPTKGFVRRSFERLSEGYCGRMEDPAEDVFITLVNTPRGNFRIFEGIREGTGFHLQRILDVVESMPEREPYSRIRRTINCMLRLSDAVAERAGIRENSLGQETPLNALPPGVADRLSLARGLIRFSEDDLGRLGIEEASLTEFVFNPGNRNELLAQLIGHTELERRPIAFRDRSAHLLLPTAVGSAITRFVIESVLSMGLARTFEEALSWTYARLLDETPILGGHSQPPIDFQRINGGQIGAIMSEVDPGRFLHLAFFVDGLDNFSQDGLAGANAEPDALSSAINDHLKHAAAAARGQANFRDGISIVVGCGFGRALHFALNDDLPDHWRLESIGAHDLVTLSWLSDFDRLSLWRLLDAEEEIHHQGITLVNVSGFLNLVAWSRELGGHLVPHGKLPDGFVTPGSESVIVVRQNAILDLRQSVITQWNPRRVLDLDGRWNKARKLGKTEFEEDNNAPLYGSEDDVRDGRLRGVFVAPGRPWWIEITAPEDAPRGAVFEHWMMLCVWLRRAAPVLDNACTSLPACAISFHVNFEEVTGVRWGTPKPKDAAELRALVHTSVDVGRSRIRISIAKGFDDGFMQPENVAERTLVEALVDGALEANGGIVDANKRIALVDKICPNAQARHIHLFAARSFRDFVQRENTSSPVLIDPLDDAGSRIGLGWRKLPRGSNPIISGVPECTSYLNDVVKVVLDDLCAELKCLDRRSLVSAVLDNHEAAAHDRDVWRRTAQANLAMHDDRNAAVRTIVDHNSRLNACFLACRVLLEAAICECPLTDVRAAGRLDLSRLMSRVMLAHFLGGWSDAVHWGAMEPRLRITPLGDVHMNLSFMDAVYEPFGRVSGESEVNQATESYSRLYAPERVRPSVADTLEPRFLDAWKAEYGASLDEIRTFVDRLEEFGQQPPKDFFELPRSALRAMLSEAAGISLENPIQTLDWLTLKPLPQWRMANSEFENRDWYPWRFGRRRSILRRPLIQIDTGDDPTIVVAPGLVREAFQAAVGWFHNGEISSQQTRSREMCSWIGHANNVQRVAFNSVVASRMRELDWQVEQGTRLTKILGRSLGRDYGDIDVLAWRPDSGRVLVMECKDLQFHKTIGEIAEQLADFRGEVRAGGKPDHLKRHLNRLELLSEYKPAVQKALKLASPIQMEGHLVFKNPVPMRFAWDNMASRIRLSLFAELDRI
jgi:hypothetical protein